MPILLFRREENSSLEDKSNNTDHSDIEDFKDAVITING
ncbi:hypothetical protein REISMN_05010 [Rickettsia tamurae subsp. buchneri]|uniref:Uncharacterized protein n=1 Tax=Rickettsia tamurae subsp. buchneri TaxID=1462938 RepID=A0A8E0WLH0_9RICK|nr:hypothetical protein REIS_0287 [Rickettsia endosymbiont of Ixodes scapularis]KDO02815.1 hypothetical protein REISMN_05010 [Rickettsia tamurae subsp. buchneri]